MTIHRIESNNFTIVPVEDKEEPLKTRFVDSVAKRPEIVNAQVYKLRSNFVKHNVYVTLGYVEEENRKRPIEIFINSKDLTKNAEYTVLTRLISAIFRKSSNPSFILEELSTIQDPNGGYHKNGKYIHSFYSELAGIIEEFFKHIGCVESKDKKVSTDMKINVTPSNDDFKVCPECGSKSVKMENGCLSCIEPSCSYSKCDH